MFQEEEEGISIGVNFAVKENAVVEAIKNDAVEWNSQAEGNLVPIDQLLKEKEKKQGGQGRRLILGDAMTENVQKEIKIDEEEFPDITEDHEVAE